MSLEIKITISDEDETFLKNDLLDIEDWVQKAVAGKINNCKKRFIAEWQVKLMNDPNVESIPANPKGMLNMVISRPDYKNRAKREKEEKK